MSKRIIYKDVQSSNELEFFLNEDNQLFLQCGDIDGGDDSIYYSGWVCLDKQDVKDIIYHLQQLLPLM